MQLLQKCSLLLLLQVITTTWASSDTSSPYCYKNVTEVSYKIVTKTRIKTVGAKGAFRKIFNKKETQIEVYEDREPVYKSKVQRSCCEGYKLSEMDLCEPQCVENGCPANSKCIQPEVCECVKGYFSKRSTHDNKHYCEPICDKACPENSVCVAPNECACVKGYKVLEHQHECKPYCASGCPNGGKCIKPNVCSCAEGFKAEKGSCLSACALGESWNTELHKCESSSSNEHFSTTIYPDFTEIPETTISSLEVETDIESSNDDIDPNQVFDEVTDITMDDSSKDYDSSSPINSLAVKHKCADDYVFHNDECSPLTFVTVEIDCLLKPCQDENAKCLENGTCACNDGFKWFRTHVVDHETLNQTIKAVCLSLAEYETKLQLLKEEPAKAAVEKTLTAAEIFFIVLGVLVMLTALVFLVYKLVFSHRGEMNVEDKTLACTFDNRTCCEAERPVVYIS